MKDFLQRDLETGQYVIFSQNTISTKLEFGLILGFTKQKVKLRVFRDFYDFKSGKRALRPSTSHKSPENICIISQEDAILYYLKKV